MLAEEPPPVNGESARNAQDPSANDQPSAHRPEAGTAGGKQEAELTPSDIAAQQAAFLRAIFATPVGCPEMRVVAKSKYDRGGWIVPDSQYGGVMASWYKASDDLIADAAKLRGVSAYILVNPAVHDLLARSYCKLERQADTTRNEDIVALRNLLIDIDPKRKKGISATEKERLAALECRDRILVEHPEIADASI
jgi:hypothetical protein